MVIDGPPRVTELARSIILAADVVVIPVQPSPLDVWAATETVDLIKEARMFKEGLRAVIAINCKIGLITDALTIEAQDAREAGALGYMARAPVQATLPHSRPEGTPSRYGKR